MVIIFEKKTIIYVLDSGVLELYYSQKIAAK